MLLFRSEEHIGRWCETWSQPLGGLLSPQQTWGLAKAWYGEDRRETTWCRKTKEETQAIFRNLGLSVPFWEL
jgi:hypothetical protein